jgi:hypothetical protein
LLERFKSLNGPSIAAPAPAMLVSVDRVSHTSNPGQFRPMFTTGRVGDSDAVLEFTDIRTITPGTPYKTEK